MEFEYRVSSHPCHPLEFLPQVLPLNDATGLVVIRGILAEAMDATCMLCVLPSSTPCPLHHLPGGQTPVARMTCTASQAFKGHVAGTAVIPQCRERPTGVTGFAGKEPLSAEAAGIWGLFLLQVASCGKYQAPTQTCNGRLWANHCPMETQFIHWFKRKGRELASPGYGGEKWGQPMKMFQEHYCKNPHG